MRRLLAKVDVNSRLNVKVEGKGKDFSFCHKQASHI